MIADSRYNYQEACDLIPLEPNQTHTQERAPGRMISVKYAKSIF